jgi:cell division protein FtsB
MPQDLTDLVIKEISLVDDGANPGAHVEIVKSRQGDGGTVLDAIRQSPLFASIVKGVYAADKQDAKTFNEALAEIDAMRRADEKISAIWRLYDAFMTSLRSIVADKAIDNKKAAIRESAEQFKAALTELAPQIVEKALSGGVPDDPDAPATAAAFLQETIMNLEELTKSLEAAEAKLTELEKRATDAEAEVKKLKDDNAAKDAEIAKLKTPAPTEEDLVKALPESVRKMVQDSQKQAADALAEVEKMKTQAETTEAIAKARTYGIGDAAVLGPIMLRIAKGKSTAEDATAIEAVLKAAAAQAKVSPLFKSQGNGGDENGGDPEALLKAKAEEIRKANPKLSFAQAYTQATEENPDLYRDYVAKRRA